MTPKLRTIHRRVWILLSVTLIALSIGAIAVIPAIPYNDILYQAPEPSEQDTNALNTEWD